MNQTKMNSRPTTRFGGGVTERVTNNWEDTEFYADWNQRVVNGHPNDFVICLTASPYTGVSGAGKSTAATAIAKQCDVSDNGFDAEDKVTLDAGELAYDILPGVEEGSAVIYDEGQGTPGTDSLNKKRAMKGTSLAAINAILANRDKRITLIVVGQLFNFLNKDLYPIVDAWLLIQQEPDEPDGPLMTYHLTHVNPYDLGSSDVKTPAVEDLRWPFIPHDDPDYQVVERKKQEAKRRRNEEDDGELSPPESLSEMEPKHRNPIIKDLYERGVPQDTLADSADLQQGTISKIVNEND